MSSSSEEQQPFLLPDLRTLYFASIRSSSWDIYVSERAQVDAPFQGVDPVLATGDDDTAYAIQHDGLVAYLSRALVSQSDLFEAARGSPSEAFGAFVPINALNTAADEYDPHPSVDGLRLYFLRSVASPATGALLVAERPTPGAPFGSASSIPEVTMGPLDSNPSISADERLLVFASDRGGPTTGMDLYFATRADRSLPFDPPQPVPGLNTSADESEVFVREDGCEVFFSSDRADTLGVCDLYRVDVLS